MKIIVVIQARMGSSRLPGKILLPLGDYINLDYVTARCKAIKGVSEVIVATSLLTQDDAVEQWCRQHHIQCYRGSEENVLSRYIEASQPYEPDYVIRVTADCPFVDVAIAEDMVDIVQQHKVDIVDLKESLPRGIASEIISYKALKYIYEHATHPYHFEHVTYYAYENKNEFTRYDYLAPSNRLYPELRITLDTPEDYALLKILGETFNNRLVKTEKVIAFLRDHPELISINAHIEQKSVK